MLFIYHLQGPVHEVVRIGSVGLASIFCLFASPKAECHLRHRAVRPLGSPAYPQLLRSSRLRESRCGDFTSMRVRWASQWWNALPTGGHSRRHCRCCRCRWGFRWKLQGVPATYPPRCEWPEQAAHSISSWPGVHAWRWSRRHLLSPRHGLVMSWWSQQPNSQPCPPATPLIPPFTITDLSEPAGRGSDQEPRSQPFSPFTSPQTSPALLLDCRGEGPRGGQCHLMMTGCLVVLVIMVTGFFIYMGSLSIFVYE